jgi:hypothetical protein
VDLTFRLKRSLTADLRQQREASARLVEPHGDAFAELVDG